jgi:dihydroxyacid dehydratase/phosphogluconate dehydratase
MRVRVEIMGSQKCRIVGKSQPICISMIHPVISTRTQWLFGGRGSSVRGRLKPSTIVTKASMENAITCYNLMGGSTNAVIHLIAIAGRLGIKIPLDKFDDIGKVTPLLANLRPTGKEYLMEDFYYAGGAPSWIRSILTDIYRCRTCSCQEILRTETPGQGCRRCSRGCRSCCMARRVR